MGRYLEWPYCFPIIIHEFSQVHSVHKSASPTLGALPFRQPNLTALKSAKYRCASTHVVGKLSNAAGKARLNDREQPSLPQAKAMALLVLIGVQIIDLMQARFRVCDEKLPDKILYRQRG